VQNYNPEKAQKLLEEEGWKENKDGFLERKGEKIHFTLITNQGNKEREKAATILQEQFRKIGVQLNIQVMEWSAELKILNNQELPRKFDVILIGWSLGIDPDDYNIWHSSQYPTGFNFIKYKNLEVDRLLELGRITLDREKRKEIYGKIYELIAEDQPYIFLWYPKAIVGINKRVHGLSKPGPAGLFVDIEKVYVENSK
jgi:peptide/nickel transport system substrate-binding protein